MITPLHHSPYQSSLKKIVIRKPLHIKTSSLKEFPKSFNKTSLTKSILPKEVEKPEEFSEKILKKIQEKLSAAKKASKDQRLNFEVFEMYKNIFAEIIKFDSVFGVYLEKIKAIYEEWIKIKVGYVAENTQLKYEIVGLNEQINNLSEELQIILRSNDDLRMEYEVACKEVDDRNHQYRKLQDYLVKISTIKDDECPKNSGDWKILVAENKKYSDLCESLQEDVEKLAKKTKELMRVLGYIESIGVPVNKIMEDMRNMKKAGNKKKLEEEEGSEKSEYLTNSPKKDSKKPAYIPNLELDNLEYSIFPF
jgi:hypothetical protein